MANQFLDEVSLTEQSSSSAMNIIYQEEVYLPEETSMLLRDLDLPMPFKYIFEVQEPPAEVLAMQKRIRGQSVSNDPTIAQNSTGKQTSDHPKAPFVS